MRKVYLFYSPNNKIVCLSNSVDTFLMWAFFPLDCWLSWQVNSSHVDTLWLKHRHRKLHTRRLYAWGARRGLSTGGWGEGVTHEITRYIITVKFDADTYLSFLTNETYMQSFFVLLLEISSFVFGAFQNQSTKVSQTNSRRRQELRFFVTWSVIFVRRAHGPWTAS